MQTGRQYSRCRGKPTHGHKVFRKKIEIFYGIINKKCLDLYYLQNPWYSPKEHNAYLSIWNGIRIFRKKYLKWNTKVHNNQSQK